MPEMSDLLRLPYLRSQAKLPGSEMSVLSPAGSQAKVEMSDLSRLPVT